MIEVYPTPQPEKDTSYPQYHDPIQSCDHAFEVRRMDCVNGAIQFRRQCTRCGTSLPAVSKHTLTSQEQHAAPPFDHELKHNVQAVAWEQRQVETALVDGAFDTRWWSWYHGYLNSQIWGRRRSAVLKRAHGVCECCSKERAIIAHHLTYVHVGAEPLFDLAAVCSTCHDQIHEKRTT